MSRQPSSPTITDQALRASHYSISGQRPQYSTSRNRWAWIVALWIVCLALDLLFSFGFAGFFDLMILLLMVSIPILLLAAFPIGNWRRRMAYTGITLLVFTGTELLAASVITEWQGMHSKPLAQPIINALQKHKEKHGEYPTKLESLVPEFMAEIPTTRMGWFGEPFGYARFPAYEDHDEYYALIINVRAMWALIHYADRGWVFHD